MYDADNDRKISRRDFSDFFEKSWLAQVEIVLDKVKNIPNTNVQQLNAWSRERRQDILQLATQIFNDLDDQKKQVRLLVMPVSGDEGVRKVAFHQAIRPYGIQVPRCAYQVPTAHRRYD